MPSALRAGLAGLVDYAGLFPPASLSLRDVAGRYAAYAASNERWMLGRLIVPLAQLDALGGLVKSAPASQANWSVSALLAADTPLDRVDSLLKAVDDRHRGSGLAIASVEIAPVS
jgi:hypothetical protein